MTPEIAAALREPFAAELIGKLPRIWCGNCRDAKGKVCSQHHKTRCDECQNSITDAHLHLDYVGHADVTDRLLQVDPEWTWEPLALTAEGLPAFGNGGLWIRMTVAGVTRLGFGDAPGKAGGDAVKEVIGDAIRNAALRFGVGLDLWRKEKPAVDDGGSAQAKPTRARRSTAKEAAAEGAPERPASRSMITAVMASYTELGYGGEANKAARLTVSARLLGLDTLDSHNSLTAEQGSRLLDALAERKRTQQADRQPSAGEGGKSDA